MMMKYASEVVRFCVSLGHVNLDLIPIWVTLLPVILIRTKLQRETALLKLLELHR